MGISRDPIAEWVKGYNTMSDRQSSLTRVRPLAAKKPGKHTLDG